MSREAKLLLKVFGVILVLGVVSIVTAGAMVYHAGVLTVRVHQKSAGGTDIFLPIPAALMNAGIAFMPEEDLGRVREGLGPYRPIVQTICDELARIPDGPLVEVTGPEEKIRVVKKGSDLVIDVDTREEVVHVSIPLRSVTTFLKKLGGSSGRWI